MEALSKPFESLKERRGIPIYQHNKESKSHTPHNPFYQRENPRGGKFQPPTTPKGPYVPPSPLPIGQCMFCSDKLTICASQGAVQVIVHEYFFWGEGGQFLESPLPILPPISNLAKNLSL